MRKRSVSLFLLLILVALLLCSCTSKNTNDLQIYFLNVGQGDATFLSFDNHNILIDTGSEDSQNDLCYRLKSLGVSEIDLLILSHGDEDHIGGADKICEEFTVKEVWYNDTQENDSVRAFLATNTPSINAFSGKEYEVSNSQNTLCISVLFPTIETELSDSNNSSMIVNVIFGGISLIFMGDAETTEEEELLSLYQNGELQADLLKIGHHGSSTSTSDEFLTAINPTFAVISCLKNNPYGHPHGEVINRLNEKGITVYRTDIDGEIHFSSNGININYIEN